MSAHRVTSKRWPELNGLTGREYMIAHRKIYRRVIRRPFCECGNPATIKASDNSDICERCKRFEDTRKVKVRKMQEGFVLNLPPLPESHQPQSGGYYNEPPPRTEWGYGPLQELTAKLATM